jgi:septation ring formation regulator EzrA
MSEFGQCSEPSCSENTVRLFDCVHHCMKLVCLQHLIEHDRLIEHNQDYLNNLHTEVKQLWTTYSSLADETKLRFEFEQKLKKHQQIIQDISNLFEMNSGNVEHYRLMVEKLNQNIEQLNQSDTESVSHVEQVKIEPKDLISTSDELGKNGYC